jgi:hypothetical protein
MSYTTTPCPKCDEPCILVSVGITRVYLDPAAPVYHRLVCPETRAGYWLRDEPPKGEGRQSLARHRCAKESD